MKTYLNEQDFVQNFNKDIKVETEFSVNGKNFTAKYAGKNDSKQSIYSVTIDGTTKTWNITQLKKKLGVTWTAERSNAGSDNTTKTTFADKSDEELFATAKQVADKVRNAMDIINKIADKYAIETNILVDNGTYINGEWIVAETLICDSLKQQRAKAIQEKQEKAEKAEADKKQRLQAKLAELQKMGLSKDDILAMLG